jgi:hypothetical protein
MVHGDACSQEMTFVERNIMTAKAGGALVLTEEQETRVCLRFVLNIHALPHVMLNQKKDKT